MHATYSFKKNNAIEIIYKTTFKLNLTEFPGN